MENIEVLFTENEVMAVAADMLQQARDNKPSKVYSNTLEQNDEVKALFAVFLKRNPLLLLSGDDVLSCFLFCIDLGIEIGKRREQLQQLMEMK